MGKAVEKARECSECAVVLHCQSGAIQGCYLWLDMCSVNTNYAYGDSCTMYNSHRYRLLYIIVITMAEMMILASMPKMISQEAA